MFSTKFRLTLKKIDEMKKICLKMVFSDPVSLDYLVSLLTTVLADESTVTVRAACAAVKVRPEK